MPKHAKSFKYWLKKHIKLARILNLVGKVTYSASYWQFLIFLTNDFL